jgi:PAS domain S-box-containing protein
LRLDELPAQRAARGEEVRDFEFSLAFDDGTTKHLLGYGAPLRDEQGRPRGAVHVLVDITGRKQAADALRTSEQRMALFIEHAPASLAMFDRDMRYLSVSRRWMSDYRLGNRELRGISHYDVFPEIPERWRAVIRRALAGEVVRDDSDRFDRTDGTAQWLRWEVRPWYDVAGTVAGIVIFTEEITEQKKTEEALRQSEERYRLLFERAGDAIFILEAAGPRAGAIIEANKTAAEMHGYTIDELRSLRIMDLDAPDTARESPGMITRILNGEWITREIVHRRKDGTLFPVELNAGLLQLKERKFILAIDRDITERKRTERERERVLLDLKRRTAELDTMFQALPYLVSVHGPDGRYVRVNPAMISLLGFDPTGAAREDVARRVKARFPDGRLLVPDNMPSSSALAGEAVHDVEYIVTDAQGRDHVLLFNAIPLRVEGHVYGAVLAQMDITERKQAEEALRKAKDLSDVLNRINKAVHSTFDFDEIMRRVITEAGNAIGCDSAAISLRKKDRWVVAYAHGFPQDVAGSHLHEEGQSHAVLALKTSKPVVIEDALHDARLNTEHMKKHSIRSVLIVPLVAGEEHLGAIFFNHHTAAGSFSDAQIDFADKLASTITLAIENARLFEERRRAEERVNNLNEELKRSLFELEAVNIELESFSYSVSHDLRAPLRSIEGFTTAIIEDCAATLDETGRDYFNRIVAASRRMSQLIDAMLHMARLTRSEIREQVVNLSALAEGIVPELKRGQPGRQAAFIIAPELKVQGDTGMLRIVLENLLDNAFKFTNRHRTANIEFGSTEMEGKTVYFVRDDGAGFDMRYADKLFNPFKRLHTESEFPGIGIGLATAHRIISRHNGRIWAESEPEKGATFYFTL